MAMLTTIVHKRKMSLQLKVRPFLISKILKSQNDTFLDKYPRPLAAIFFHKWHPHGRRAIVATHKAPVTLGLRPGYDLPGTEIWANRRKNVRLVAEVVRLVAEVVGDRKGQISRSKVVVMFKTQSHRASDQGSVVGAGRRIRLDEDSSSGLASLRTSELLLRIAGVRRNEAPRRNESPYSLRGHRRTAHA